MDKSIRHCFLRFSRKAFLGTLCGAASLLLAALPAPADTTIESISVDTPDNKTYGYGETIRIKVEFSSAIQSISGTPILELNIQNQNNSSRYSANNEFANYAIYDASLSSGRTAYFTYTVKAGDHVEDLDVIDLNPPGSSGTITFLGGSFDWDIPTGDNPRSLDSNSNVGIQTIVFQEYATATPDISMVEDDEKSLVITRGGAASMEQRFNVSSFDPDTGAAMSSGDKITYPSLFTIPANADRAELAVTAVETGMQSLRLHPVGYDGTNGDLVATITVTPSLVPSMVRINSSVSEIYEGSTPFTAQISLSRAPKEAITVTVSSSDINSLRISGVDSAVGALRNNTAVLYFAKGQQGPYAVTFTPMDGYNSISNSITVTATANKTYSSGSQRIRVLNSYPQIFVPLDENDEWVVSGFSAMSEGAIYWAADDVAADQAAGFTATINWGDGVFETVNCGANCYASHTYDEPFGDPETGEGGYRISLTVTDKDGGRNYCYGRVVVSSPITVLLGEFKRQEGHTGRNSYISDQTGQEMQGMGEGSIAYRVGSQPFTTAYRTVLAPNYDWTVYFQRTKQTITFKGQTERFADTHRATGAENVMHDSFFHVWIGEDFVNSENVTNPAYHISTTMVSINGDEEDPFFVGGVFSRENYPEDNYPDIDFDQLPDEWENMVWPSEYAFEDIGGSDGRPYGCYDNPDGDCFPACVVGIAEDGSFIVSGSYYGATGGLSFSNVHEVRGTHWGLNAKYSDCVEPQDEPHCGSYDASGNFTDDDNRAFYGTDPTLADTDNDGLTDGWEYFFWRQASFSATPVGLRRNGNGTISQIANAEIAAMFNPCVSIDHQLLDIDGDGLSNYEEFLRGTSPILWDTDGDGLADGYYEPVQTITLDPAGGTVSPDSVVRNYGEVYGELPVPVKKGYAFRSWTLYGNAVSAVATVSCITNHTLVATWHANAIPTIEDLLEAAIDGANFADDGVKEAIGGDFTKYAEFRAWAQTVPGGEDAVVASERAAISYLLGTDTLIANDIESDDVHITEFSIDHGAESCGSGMQFSFEVAIDGVYIGSSAAIASASLKENMKKAIGIEGATRLDGEFSSENIELTFDTPVDGKARLTATPPPDAGTSFFMRAKVQ